MSCVQVRFGGTHTHSNTGRSKGLYKGNTVVRNCLQFPRRLDTTDELKVKTVEAEVIPLFLVPSTTVY